jgi:4-carboxymuconolactone decarboxylase
MTTSGEESLGEGVGTLKHAAVAALALSIVSPLEAQERQSVAPKAMQAIAPGLAGYTDDVLFGDVWRRKELSQRDRSLVTLSVLIATGKTAQIGSHLQRGLDNGITPTEIAGLVTHLAFYSGWPNAVSALHVIEQIFADRKIGASSLSQTGDAPATSRGPDGPVAAAEDRNTPAASKLAELTNDVLLGSLWQRLDLLPRDRSLVTIAALAANGDKSQLETHLRLGRENGLTDIEISEAITHLAFYAGWPKAMSAAGIAGTALDSRRNAMPTSRPAVTIVPPGQTPSPGPAANFTGSVLVTSAFKGSGAARLGGGTVTFQPGAHTNWHTHPLGQLLIVTAGNGWVQANGEPARMIKTGDTVWIGPGVKHWHGAARETAMTHVAVSEALDGKSVDWLEPVSDREYSEL